MYLTSERAFSNQKSALGIGTLPNFNDNADGKLFLQIKPSLAKTIVTTINNLVLNTIVKDVILKKADY